MSKIKTKKITIGDLKVTIDDIAVAVSDGFKEVAEGFKKQEKLTDEKIDNLAAMTKRGFDKTAKKEDLDIVKQDLDIVKQELIFVKSDVEDIKEKVENIEKLILQQHSFQIKELENKVRYIEEVLTIGK